MIALLVNINEETMSDLARYQMSDKVALIRSRKQEFDAHYAWNLCTKYNCWCWSWILNFKSIPFRSGWKGFVDEQLCTICQFLTSKQEVDKLSVIHEIHTNDTTHIAEATHLISNHSQKWLLTEILCLMDRQRSNVYPQHLIGVGIKTKW